MTYGVPLYGIVNITLPQDVKIQQGVLSACTVVASGVTCTASLQVITVKFSTVPISTNQQVLFNFPGYFTTPQSTAPTSNFNVTSYSSAGVLIDTAVATMSVSPNALQGITDLFLILLGVSIVQNTGSTGAVEQLTEILVSLQLGSLLPSGSGVQLTFPKINPNAPLAQQLPMVSNSVQCLPSTSNVSPILSCTFANDVLSITQLVSANIPASSSLSFLINGVYNPANFTAVTVGIKTVTGDQLAVIDAGSATFLSTTATTIDPSTVSVTADNNTVQELTTFYVSFQTPISLNPNTIVTMVFPSDFTFDQQKLTSVMGYGLFGTLRDLSYTLSSSARSLKITDGIQSYRQADVSGELIISQIANPFTTKPTGSFEIYLMDSNGIVLASVESSIIYTAISGEVQAIGMSLLNQQINAVTDLTISFTLLHSLSAQNSLIQIVLPANFVTTTCIVLPGEGFDSPNFIYTKVNLITYNITQLFQSTLVEGTQLTVVFHNIQNPPSAQPVTGLSIQTFDGGSLVDSLYSSSISQLQYPIILPSLFNSQNVTAQTTYAYTVANFIFDLTLGDAIPQNGIIEIVIPPEVTPMTPTVCSGISNIKTGILQCTIDQSNGIYKVQITNGFASTSVSASVTVSFSISNLRTPPSTQTSSSFQVTTFDSSNYLIDQVTTLLTVTMLNGCNIASMNVVSSSQIVGAPTIITLAFSTPVPLTTTDILLITFPIEVTPPSPFNLTCLGSNALLASQPCTVNGQIITVNLQAQAIGVAAESYIQLRIMYATNPLSIKPTSEFMLEIKDINDYSKAQSVIGNGALFSIGSPGLLTNANITALDPRQMALTTITVNFMTSTTIPAGGIIQFDFNQIQFEFPNTSVNLTCTTNLAQNVSCALPLPNRIIVSNLVPSQPLLGVSNLSFTFDDCLISVNQKMTTDSWQITTKTADGYTIDKLTQGLTFTFPCNAPCLTCSTQNPNFCSSCNNLTDRPIFYENACYTACPRGLYLNDFYQCQPCSTVCNTCKSDDPSYCLSCNSNSNYSFLDGSTCTNTCAFGYYANKTYSICQQCSQLCESCYGTANYCLSCKQDSPFQYFLGNKCMSSCPSGYIPDQSYNNICIPCDPNCKQCHNKTNYCTSCSGNMVLSFLDNTCVNQCPNDISVYNSKSNTCTACDHNCLSCKNDQTLCTSCQEGLNLNQDVGKCVGECSNDGTMIALNGTCITCSSSCNTCIDTPDSCKTCSEGLHLYNFKCVTTCPKDYTVQINQCVIDGLICPFGYQVNPQGNGCILNAQVCESGKILNINKDRCIPLPGDYIPFPLVISCGFLSIIVFSSWLKYRVTLIATNLITCISFIESIGIFAQIILSYQMGIFSTFGLTLVSALFLFGSNLFFCLIFLKNVNSDPAFRYWTQSYQKSQNVILIVAGTLNFKIFRIIYGRLFDNGYFNTTFDDPLSFLRPFTLTSIFSILTTMLPLLIANICGIVFMQYGYQLTMNCIEMTIIEIVLLLLMIYEKHQMSLKHAKQTSYYKVDPKLLEQTVMSGAPDLSNMSSQTLHTQMSTNQKSNSSTSYQEHYERRRNLEMILSVMMQQQKAREMEDSSRDIDQSTTGEIQKLQKQEYRRMKRCKSFEEIREFNEKDGVRISDDEDLQNFISEPSSPREKEMLQNPKFAGSMIHFKRDVKQRDFFDNVYAESKSPYFFNFGEPQVSVKTQTNIIELLAIESMNERLTRHQSIMSPLKDEQSRYTLPNNRLHQIPQFTLTDIRGEFEITSSGAEFIKRGGKDGTYLVDMVGRKVNQRGFIIDNQGNIITRKGVIIFESDEIDADNQIPEPFFTEQGVINVFAHIEDYAQFKLRIGSMSTNKLSEVNGLHQEKNVMSKKHSNLPLPPAVLNNAVKPIQARSKQELFKNDMIMPNSKNRQRSNPRGRKVGQQPTPSSQGNHLKVSSIGIFDSTSMNEDLQSESVYNQKQSFFRDQRKGRNHAMITTSNSFNQMSGALESRQYRDTYGSNFDLNDGQISRLTQMKGSFEDFDGHENPKVISGSLAKRNLAQVYGKAQQPNMGSSKAFDERKRRPKVYEEFKSFGKSKTSMVPNATNSGDSRIKNLESIYQKQIQRPSSVNAFPTAIQSRQQNTVSSAWGFNQSSADIFTSKVTPLGGTSDEQIRLKKEVEKMQAVISREEKKSKKNHISLKPNSHNRQIIDGGWI